MGNEAICSLSRVKKNRISNSRHNLTTVAVKLRGEVNEDAFVEKLVKRLQGQGGVTVPGDVSAEADAEAYKSSSVVRKVSALPSELLHVLIHQTKTLS